MKTTMNLLRKSWNTLFIKYIKTIEALVKPNDITINSYCLYLVMNAVFKISLLTTRLNDTHTLS